MFNIIQILHWNIQGVTQDSFVFISFFYLFLYSYIYSYILGRPREGETSFLIQHSIESKYLSNLILKQNKTKTKTKKKTKKKRKLLGLKLLSQDPYFDPWDVLLIL